jgi:hypothetical protein
MLDLNPEVVPASHGFAWDYQPETRLRLSMISTIQTIDVAFDCSQRLVSTYPGAGCQTKRGWMTASHRHREVRRKKMELILPDSVSRDFKLGVLGEKVVPEAAPHSAIHRSGIIRQGEPPCVFRFSVL